MIIGIDDTDSRKGMCTTYLSARVVDALKRYGPVSTPLLVRLNPCIPYKTRGNGAVSFEVRIDSGRKEYDVEQEVKEVVKSRVQELSEVDEEGTNPGVVFISNNALQDVTSRLKSFYEHAVQDVLKIDDAYALIADLHCDYFGLNNKRGIIGALAAASFLVLQKAGYYDFTYELVAYRRRERWGTLRYIDEASVWKADEATYPLVWDTVDVANNTIVFAPHSPCPVLFGLRGDSTDALYKAYELIDAEPVERTMLFITNQGTDFHLIPPNDKELRDDHSYILDGVVRSNPRTIIGGHVLFSLTVSGTENVECIAYEPTKGFRNVIRILRIGDEITVFGSLKKGTINLEKIAIRKLNRVIARNPKCSSCGRSMDSAGRIQGYRCKRCGTVCMNKDTVLIEREIVPGLYEVPPVARRHISKPLVRMRGTAITIHPSR